MLNQALRIATVNIAIALATFNLSPSAHAALVDYGNIGTFTTPVLITGGITVTGSADINVWNGIGLGIVGGLHDEFVDQGEFIDFAFATPAINVSYVVSGVGGPLLGTAGDRFLEVFAVGGASLGVVPQNESGTFQVTSLFGNVMIERFRLTADDVDSFLPRSVTFDVAVVPLPAALPLFAGGLGLLGLLGWRRKKMTEAVATNSVTVGRCGPVSGHRCPRHLQTSR